MTILLKNDGVWGFGVHAFDDMQGARAKRAEVGGEMYWAVQIDDPMGPYIARLRELGVTETVTLSHSDYQFDGQRDRDWFVHIAGGCERCHSWDEVEKVAIAFVAKREKEKAIAEVYDPISMGC